MTAADVKPLAFKKIKRKLTIIIRMQLVFQIVKVPRQERDQGGPLPILSKADRVSAIVVQRIRNLVAELFNPEPCFDVFGKLEIDIDTLA